MDRSLWPVVGSGIKVCLALHTPVSIKTVLAQGEEDEDEDEDLDVPLGCAAFALAL